MNKIRTVQGDITAEEVGSSMIHEHIIFDITPPHKRALKTNNISMNDRWQIDYLSNENPENSSQKEVSIAVNELRFFSDDGGSLIVDQSVFGLDRSPNDLLEISKLSGIHIVAAAGCYTEPYLQETYLKTGIDELINHFVSEVQIGLDGTSIKAGIIGEIGCSWPLTAFEKKAIIAAACAADKTGTSLSIHPGRAPDACLQILEIIEPTGLDPDRIIFCHMDRTHPDGTGVKQLLQLGVNVEWDFFGIEQSYYWMGNLELPNDFDRLKLINTFADEGHENQILISHDICTKSRMRSFGGHGYSHILRNVPELMKRLGLDTELFKQLTHTNPRKVLALRGD